MRIHEILFWNNDPTEQNHPESQLDLSPDPSRELFTKLARTYAKDCLKKRFWKLKGSQRQPPGSVPLDAETELIPSGTLEPTAGSW